MARTAGTVLCGLLLLASAGRAAECTPATLRPQNVVFLVDTSGSMAHVLWHPDFDPEASHACSPATGGHDATLFAAHDVVQTRCGTTRTYRADPELAAAGVDTRFDPGYLNWLHALPDGDPRLAEIAAGENGVGSACVGEGPFALYRQSRMSAAKRLLRHVICRLHHRSEARMGLARLRTGADPEGGYLVVPAAADGPGQLAALLDALDDLQPEGWGPLGEALFQVYTYFMSRDEADRPLGADGITRFPPYAYGTDTAGAGGPPTGSPPPTPPGECRKHALVVVGDDAPTKDDFDPSGSGRDLGFAVFGELIGDYLPDGTSEEPGTSPTCTTPDCEVALYLDDIASFMGQRDFRPDLPDQYDFIRVHTVGLLTTDFELDLLARTAYQGEGTFFLHTDGDVLADELLVIGPEVPVCRDGLDNDGDGAADWDGAGQGPADPDCMGNPDDPNEACGLGAELVLLAPLLWRLRRARRSRAA